MATKIIQQEKTVTKRQTKTDSVEEQAALELASIRAQLKVLNAKEKQLVAHFKGQGWRGAKTHGTATVIISETECEYMDQDAVRALLGTKTPVFTSPKVTLSVVVA